METSAEKRYRPNAAVVITDGQGRVLLCERAFGGEKGTFQTVQGGIDKGETAQEAAARELGEELGLEPASYKIIGEMPGTVRYDWTDAYVQSLPYADYHGQEVHFFLARVAPDTTFFLDRGPFREFATVRWGDPADLVRLAWERKKPGLEKALRHFGLL